jgi:hypothetical protein
VARKKFKNKQARRKHVIMYTPAELDDDYPITLFMDIDRVGNTKTRF